jgi:methylenetetrahydrofolate dehydrogenase (NADP+)/methenyltetrahydrofolate cyclohydrolase
MVKKMSKIKKFNIDPSIDGILIQLPLPDHLNTQELIDIVEPNKDVDGLTAINAGKRGLGLRSLLPCTPKGCLKLIKTIKQDLSGLHAVIIGRSDLVGKPMGQLLLQENCTVSQTHSHTRNLEELCRQADILVVAVGQPLLVKRDWVKPSAIVIDVGINRLSDDHLVGDVDFAAVAEHVYAITPVPGGVGPMTIACLLENTVEAAESAYLNDNV